MSVVVAVSGGVDSVALLHMFVAGQLKASFDGLTVAHFDHGMRSDSAADARFVRGLALGYGLEFVERREELNGVNEEQARAQRYAFLFEEAEKRQARLVTAHHLDDLIETVALNIRRGTRWRGLACMSDERIWRPLLNRTKSELRRYATKHQLEWVEDETNQQSVYTRNRLRKKTSTLPLTHSQKIRDMWQNQLAYKDEINREINELHFPIYERYFMMMIPSEVAHELLYIELRRKYGVSLLADQLAYALLAIKTGGVQKRWHIGQKVEIELALKTWRVQMQEK